MSDHEPHLGLPDTEAPVSGMPEAVPLPTWEASTEVPRWLVPLDRAVVVIRRACEGIVLLAVITMVVSVTVQVAARYVFEVVIVGPAEISRYAMTTSVFMGLSVLAATMGHIRLDALFTFLPSAGLRRWLVNIVLLFELVFLVVFAWLAWGVVESLIGSEQSSAGLEIRLLWPTVPLFIGSALAAFVTATMLLRSVVLGTGDPVDA